MATLIGRDRELAWLTSRLEATVAHGTSLALLHGLPGVGKSRLLTELRDSARLGGFAVLEGRCVPHAAFAPFVSIAAQALALLRERGDRELLAPVDLDALAPLVSSRAARLDPEDQDEATIRFVDAVTRLLGAAGRPRPVLVLLRGLRHADEATRALLRALLDAAGPAGEPTPGAPSALLLGAVRRLPELGELGDHPRAHPLALEGLELDAVRKLIAQDAFVTRLHSATGGNPASILALVQSPSAVSESEPATRVAQLGETALRLLGALGAAGRALPVAVLARATALDTAVASRAVPTLVDGRHLWRDLDAAAGDVVVGLVERDAGVAALGSLTPEQRATLHTHLGEALRDWGRVPQEEVLEHQLRGEHPAEAAQDVPEVAQSLVRRHAPSLALGLLARAAPYCDGATLQRAAPVAAQAAKLSGGYAEARALVERAVQSAPEDPGLRRLAGSLALAVGDLDACDASLGAAIACVGEGASTMRGAIEAVRAELFYQRGELTQAEQAARDAIQWTAPEDPLHTQARNTLTKVFMWRGELDRAWDWTQENIARSRAHNGTTETLRGVINLGVIAIRRGELDEAGRQFDSARAITARGGTTLMKGCLRENEAVVAHLRGRFGDALALYQEALGLLVRAGHRQFLARIANNLGELYVQVGDTARARRLCDYAAQVGRGLARGVSAEGLLLRGQLELLEGRGEAARTALGEALSLFTAAGESAREAEAHLLLARVALSEGDVLRVAQALASAAVDPEAAGLRVAAERMRLEAELRRAEGGDPSPAARRALDLAERAGDQDLCLRAHVVLGVVALDQHDVVSARRHAEFAEKLRGELLARVPESLRVTYDATMTSGGAGSGLGALLGRLERLPSALSAVVAVRSPSPVGAEWNGLLGDSAPMQALRRTIARVAQADTTVLLRGESGTGKERAAEAIHRASRRRAGPMVKVNCAALAEGLLLSELFGHEKGSFTGADRRRRGRFEAADGGTLFLDEIGDISPAMQLALLRVLQERVFERLGGSAPVRVDVRVLAATNRNLEEAMQKGQFREDLYYRLADITIRLPPLRERAEDIPALSTYLLEHVGPREFGVPPRKLAPSALRKLLEYQWPGNVRELGSVLRAAAVLCEGEEIGPDDLALRVPLGVAATQEGGRLPGERSEVDLVYERVRAGVPLFEMRKELEKSCIARALEEAGGNITRAASLLGMKRPRLSQLVHEYGLAKAGIATDNDDP